MMLSSNPRRPCWSLLQLLALMSVFFHHGHALTQTYCSDENTGSDYSGVTDIYQSTGLCHDQCVDDYAFAIVQYQECWCSNYIPADQVSVSECDTSCPGYPDEDCGNDSEGLYGYISLTLSASGTAGGSSSTASSTSSSQTPTTSTAATSTTKQSTTSSSPSSSSVTTAVSAVSVTVVSTVLQSQSVVVSVLYVTPTSSTAATTSSSSLTTAFVAVPSDSSSSVSWTDTTLVSTRIITLSGAPVTQTVTSTSRVVAPSADQQQVTKKETSAGTIAGAVVGSIVGLALILLGVFLLWRRRRNTPGDAGPAAGTRGKPMERNTSVLSKTGLLSAIGVNTHDPEKSSVEVPPIAGVAAQNQRQSTMYESSGPSPVSPVGTSGFNEDSQRSRRGSRPMVFDQRLNPVAIMQHWDLNGSRASVGTMQDQRDYSRPLGVTNPDPVDD